MKEYYLGNGKPLRPEKRLNRPCKFALPSWAGGKTIGKPESQDSIGSSTSPRGMSPKHSTSQHRLLSTSTTTSSEDLTPVPLRDSFRPNSPPHRPVPVASSPSPPIDEEQPPLTLSQPPPALCNTPISKPLPVKPTTPVRTPHR